MPVATHLTCVGLTPPEIRDYLARAMSQGVENVVALRGDPPRGETEFKPIAGGFSYANELVAFIRSEFATWASPSAAIPKRTRRRRARSRPREPQAQRSTPAPTWSSPSCSTTTTTSSASAIAAASSASTCRSSRACCR